MTFELICGTRADGIYNDLKRAAEAARDWSAENPDHRCHIRPVLNPEHTVAIFQRGYACYIGEFTRERHDGRVMRFKYDLGDSPWPPRVRMLAAAAVVVSLAGCVAHTAADRCIADRFLCDGAPGDATAATADAPSAPAADAPAGPGNDGPACEGGTR